MPQEKSGYSCNGCSAVFTRQSDLNQHHLKTPVKACQDAANATIARIRKSRLHKRQLPKGSKKSTPPISRSRSRSPPVVGDTEEAEDTPQLFSGDFFGDNYNTEDFPGFESSQGNLDAEKEAEELRNGAEEEQTNEAALEDTWEPPRHPIQSPAETMDIDVPPPAHNENPLLYNLPAHRNGIHITKFEGRAGEAVSGSTPQTFHSPKHGFEAYQSKIPGSSENVWAPFASKMDWEIAHWAKMRGTGSTAFSDLLAIQGVAESLDLSYRNSNELNHVIDHDLPSRRPAFSRQEVVVGGKAYDFYTRNALDCVRALYGNPDHAQYLSFTPERHYADAV
ncbi:hypothetical protein K435DRAFT_444376 [Dendrothele bispora CBS 962.96]|uniref:C2H2-type domain-containing protein n=1 Tax=Dendrothele bispora (strain CBS 962.96) TaxID=1314807 RepID=A0A4S8L2R9_DENBC|nr:hypothetical protein K435DRAFT_444376 [Dendrothele bispora CBS 962.96]